jgi:rRNA maturation endonuclease Nob1
MILFVGILLYVIRANAKVHKIFSSANLDHSRVRVHRLNKEEIKVKYACLLCGEEVKGLNCNKCGSLLKKAMF